MNAALIIIDRYERSSGADKQVCIGSQAEADRGNAENLSIALGYMIENGDAEFWIANRTGYPDRTEQVLRNLESPTFFWFPRFVKQ